MTRRVTRLVEPAELTGQTTFRLEMIRREVIHIDCGSFNTLTLAELRGAALLDEDEWMTGGVIYGAGAKPVSVLS